MGGDLALSPKHRFTATGTYTLPLPQSVGRVSLGATYIYTAKQIAQADSPIGTMPSTDLVNLNLNWGGIAGTPVDLSIFATNVTKEKHPVFVAGSATSAGFDGYVVGLPRMYGARLRYSF